MTTTTTKTTTRTATQNGTCQVCGQLQAVNPKTGGLAQHGYTVRWGFFSGVCTGSGWGAFEVTTDRIAYSIENAKQKREQLRFAAKDARMRTADDAVWVRFYAPSKSRGTISAYVWQQVERVDVDVQTHAWGDSAHVVNPFTKRRVDVNEGHYDTGVWFARTNGRYAEHCELEARKVDDYIVWQQERIASWQPQELKTRTKRGAR